MRRLAWLTAAAIITGWVPGPDTTARANALADADTFVIDTTNVRVVVPQPRTLTDNEWAQLNLGRAVDKWRRNDLRGAAALLETIDISPQSTFSQADRAAFLLSASYLQLGDIDAFRRVADRAGGPSSPFRAWIQYARFAHPDGGESASGVSGNMPGAAIITASVLLEHGHPEDAVRLLESSKPADALRSIHLYLLAIARERAGESAQAAWQELSARQPGSRHEADLVATAILRLATTRIENGTDASDLLQKVPRDSRLAPRALHLLGVFSVEEGDTLTGRQTLESVLNDYPIYESRRDVLIALGALEMDRRQWRNALDDFEAAESDWLYEFDQLDHFDNDEMLAEIWHAWRQPTLWRDEIRLAQEVVVDDVIDMAGASLDLHGKPSLTAREDLAPRLWPKTDDNIEVAAWDRTDALQRYYPLPDEWAALRELEARLATAEQSLDRQEYAVGERQREIDRRLSYLRGGREGAGESADRLGTAVSELESILAILDAATDQLRAVRDSVLLDIVVRTRAMADNLHREILYMDAVRHFHVDGPQRQRPEKLPEGTPTPGEILAIEKALSLQAGVLVDFLAERYPELVNRSFDTLWEPRLTGNTHNLYNGLVDALDHANRIAAAIDSTMSAHEQDPALAAAITTRDSLAASVDTLRAAELALRRDISHAVAARGRDRMQSERESIDYHLANASYEIAVELATNPATNENTALITPPRMEAIDRLKAFVTRHPQSVARGESRYRLADLELMQARDDFRAKMAGFLDDTPSAEDMGNRALAPYVDYAPAIALYRAILAEDKDFPHMDAVLFNLGMILSDDGQPEAFDNLARLVEQYPKSPDCQEAWLRMGSDRFDRSDFSGSIAYFNKAIAGSDPEFRAIGLYKLGWANFEEDHFDASTDAFRQLMDLYAAEPDLAADMDLREEAEEYLVHSLARSGGASAFAAYFDDLDGRDYETTILLQLGHLMRSHALYEEAADCDALWLERYPNHEKTLTVAERLVDTYRSWNKPDQAREIKLRQASRFQPGGTWYEANRDPELREAGIEFARSAYRENAAHFHRLARETNDPATWRLALTNYEDYLAHWPDTDDAEQIHYMAGEAAFQVKDHAASLAHFEAATHSDSLPIATDAAWQRVAVADAWYRSTQHDPSTNGADSLAAVMLNAGHDFIEQFPDDEHCADIIWRQANLAYAHEWFTASAASFALMKQRFPDDKRVPLAVRLKGDSHYRHGEYEAAGMAYEEALDTALMVGQDSLVAVLQETIPLCYYKHAEGVAAADSVHGEGQAAPYFESVATRWPHYEFASQALYRAGLGYASQSQYAEATAVWEKLLSDHSDSEYVHDSAVQIALTYEKTGDKAQAAHAYERFSRLYPEDPDAPAAVLKAIDLLTASGQDVAAEEMRTIFVEQYPNETDAVMEIRSARAKRELDSVTSGAATLSGLLAASAAGSAPSSDLKAYLALAEQHPDMATPDIMAQVDYLKAEEVYPVYAGMRLTQPLPKAIEAKKNKMEELVKLYDSCAQRGVTVYARASAYRIGQVLIAFGDALNDSERPEGLSEDDLLAYDQVLEEQSWDFYDRGTDVWSELLRQSGKAEDDPGGWIAATQEALWPRLAHRFLFRPEVEYPLIDAEPPKKTASN